MRHAHGRFLSLSLTLLAGCSGRPDEQIQLAQKAMDQAKEQHASEFAPSEWKAADQSWQEAQAMLGKERFGEAGSLFTKAKARYERARDVAKSKRDIVLRDTQGQQKAIDIRYKNLKTGIEGAGPKLSAAARKSLDESCQEIDKGIDKLKAALDAGEYASAKETAQTTLRQVFEAEQELQKAVGGKRKPAS